MYVFVRSVRAVLCVVVVPVWFICVVVCVCLFVLCVCVLLVRV